MNITQVQYEKSQANNPNNDNTSIKLVADGMTHSVPLDPDNRHYQAILEWVAEGNTIEDAD
jgi:hypothetical protein